MYRVLVTAIMLIAFNLSFSITLLSEGFESMGPDASLTLPGWNEGIGYPPSTVTIQNADWYGSTFNPYSGLKAAAIYYTYADEDWLITPSINLKSTPGIDELTYWMYFEQDPDNDVRVMLSTDDGTTWGVVLKQYDGVSPDNKYEVQQVIDLSAYENETSVKIAFYTAPYDGGVSPNVYLLIDDLVIREKLTNDVRVESIYIPDTTYFIVNQPETVQAVISNIGSANQSNFIVQCEIGSYFVEATVSLNAGATDTISFVPDWTPDTAGNNNIIVTSMLGTDQDTSNDTASKIVTVYPEGTGLIEGFETGIFPPVGWTATSLDRWGESVTAHSGSLSARCFGAAIDEELITKTFELPGTNMLLKFWWKQSIDYTDSIEVKINLSGEVWTTLRVLTEESNNLWVEEVIDLSSYSSPNAKISWNYKSDGLGFSFYLDDVSAAPNFDAPDIVHSEIPEDTYSNLAYTIVAEITDPSGLSSDSIYVDTGSGFVGIANDHIVGNDYYYVIPGQPDGTLIKYYFAATNVNGYRAVNPVNAPLGYHDFKILPSTGVKILLDYSAVLNGNSFIAALDNNGYNYDIHDRYYNSIGFEEYQNYDLIIFSEDFAPDEYERSALMSFLDSGTESSVKKLLIVGDDIGYSINGTLFFDNYLKARYFADDGIGSSSSALVPVPGDSISYNNPLFIDSAYPDAVDPDPAESNATKVYTYPPDAAYSGYSAGIKYEGSTYKTVYFPFEWHEIVTSSGTESRDMLLDRTLQWLLGYPQGIIAPSPAEITETVTTGNTSSRTLEVGNSGSSSLDYNASIEYTNSIIDTVHTNNFSTALNWTPSGTLIWTWGNTYDSGSLNGSYMAYVPTTASVSIINGYLTSGIIKLSSYTSATISFEQKKSLSVGTTTVEASNDGSIWTAIYTNSTAIGAWGTPDKQTITIPATYLTATARFRFNGAFKKNQGYWAIDNVSITGSAPYTWMTLDGGITTSGTVAPSGSDPITIGFNTTGLAVGSYTANILLTSTGSNESVPVNLIVSDFLATPANITTSLVSNNVFIDWDDSAGATSYDVYSSDDPNATKPWGTPTNVLVSECTYTPTETRMFFYIVAKNATKVLNNETTIQPKSRIKVLNNK